MIFKILESEEVLVIVNIDNKWSKSFRIKDSKRREITLNHALCCNLLKVYVFWLEGDRFKCIIDTNYDLWYGLINHDQLGIKIVSYKNKL